ncbi:MAG: hypothetical protein ACUVT0_05005 [Thermochromatium sp.]
MDNLGAISEQGCWLEALRARLEQDRRANLRQARSELTNRLVTMLREAAESWPAKDNSYRTTRYGYGDGRDEPPTAFSRLAVAL